MEGKQIGDSNSGLKSWQLLYKHPICNSSYVKICTRSNSPWSNGNYAQKKRANEWKRKPPHLCSPTTTLLSTPPNAVVSVESNPWRAGECFRRLCLGSEAEAGSALGAIEDDVLALEEDVAVDGEAELGIGGLDTAKAGWEQVSAIESKHFGGFKGAELTLRAFLKGSEVDELAGDNGLVVADLQGEGGKGGAAGESEAALLRVVLGALDLLVVGLDDVGGHEHEGGAGISNTNEVALGGSAGADGVAGGGEGPEALGGVDVGVSDGAVVAGGDDGAEVVGSSSVVLEGGGHDGLGQPLSNGIGQEGLLLGRRDCVDVVEGEPDKAITLARSELLGGGGGGFDGLTGNGDAANVDSVGVDRAGGARAVAVLDLPGSALDLLGIGAGLVGGVATPGTGDLVAENPEIGRTGVEVELEGLGANGYGAEVLNVVVDRGGGDGARRGSLNGTDDLRSLLSSTVLGESLGVGNWAIGLVVGIGALVDDEAVVGVPRLEVGGRSGSCNSCEGRDGRGGEVNHCEDVTDLKAQQMKVARLVEGKRDN